MGSAVTGVVLVCHAAIGRVGGQWALLGESRGSIVATFQTSLLEPPLSDYVAYLWLAEDHA
jgi:hypothetical protein